MYNFGLKTLRPEVIMIAPKSKRAASVTLLVLFLPFGSTGQGKVGSKTIKDSKGACQISVPESWDQSVTLVRGERKVRVFSEEAQKMLVEKMFENSPTRVFYILKINAATERVAYQVSVPGDGFHCTAQINVKKGYPEEEVKKVAATLTPVK
jgi:hypothetical protein